MTITTFSLCRPARPAERATRPGYHGITAWPRAWYPARREAEPDLGRRIALAEAAHYLADATYWYAQGRDVDRAIVTLLLGVECLHRTCSEEADRRG
jgi:hypothetical protein